MNMIPQFLKPQPVPEMRQTGDFIHLDLDPDFEEACKQSIQEPQPPMQTPVERLREAMENIITVLEDEAKADKAAGDDLFRQASAKHQASCDKLAQIEKTKRALAELAYDPADDAKKSYDLAVEVKRQRGDTTWPTRASEETQPVSPSSSKRKKGREA